MARGPRPPDKPATRPTVPEVVPLIRAVYKRPDGGAGCCLHVEIDDGNIGDVFMPGMLAAARAAGHPECIAAAEAFAQLTTSQRRRVVATPGLRR